MANIPGTSSNDYIFPTANGNTYLGGAGNDTYILSGLIEANATIIITDTEGANKIQLTDGLSVTSSAFLSNTAQLTLSNGAVIQITGADNFTYDIGANATAGDVAAAPDATYSAFATALGATVPAAGVTTPATGTAYTVPSSTTTVPTLALASTTASVTEGNSGTSNMTFTVNLSAAQSSAVTVNYATANGTATAGSDYTATTGTLTFAANELSKTITVPVTGDTTFEPNETFTLTLSSPSAGIVLDPAATVATGTITNDDANAAPVVTVVPGVGGSTVTAQPGALTATGLFGNFTVTDADTTILTTTISAANGLVRLTDAANLLSYSNTYVQGTNAATITAQGSQVNLSTILDTIQYTSSGAGGSTDTLTVVTTDGTTSVTTTVPIQVAATQYLSASATDVLTGTAFGDLFLGQDAAGANFFVVDATDTITGGDGTDILRFTNAGTVAQVTAAGRVTSVEQVEIQTITDGAVVTPTLDASFVGGLQSILFAPGTEAAIANADALTVTNLSDTQMVNVSSSTSALLIGNINATAGVEILNTTLLGGVTATALTATSGGAGDILNITSSGTSTNTITLLTTNNASQSVDIGGSANLTIAGVATATVIDARDLTGRLTLTDNVATAASIQSGTGADTITMGALAINANVISTGAGNDTVTMDALGVGANVITGGTGADAITVSAAGALDTIRFADGDSPSIAAINLGGNSTLDTGDIITFTGGRADTLGAVGGATLAAGERISFTGSQSLTNTAMPNSGVLTDGQYYTVRGAYSATTGFTVNTAAGPDTLIVYDGDGSTGVSACGIVLIGTTVITTLGADLITI